MGAQLLQIETSNPVVTKNLFFAYGSNMNAKQMAMRCSHPVRVSAAFLADYRLGFYGHSAEWDSGMETAVKERGSRLWGVVYALSDLDWEQLDLWQDARFDGTGRCFHYPVEVCDLRGSRYEARMYKLDVVSAMSLPSEGYMEHILDGARENKLPPSYLDALLAIKTEPAHYAVPRLPGHDRGVAAGASCTSCASSH